MSVNTLSSPTAHITRRPQAGRSRNVGRTDVPGIRDVRDGDDALCLRAAGRNLARRRRVFRLLRTVLLAAAVVAAGWALALASFTPAAGADDTAVQTTYVTVSVAEGESLWTVAVAAAPGEDPRAVMEEIVQVNNLPSTVIHPGQELQVPKR